MANTNAANPRLLSMWALGGILVLAAALGAARPAAGAVTAGDTYAYRVVNGYNKELLGQVRYRVERLEGDRVIVAVEPDRSAAGAVRTEVYTRDGNWLRHEIQSHDTVVEYEFATAYPAFVLPLEPGKDWSVRVNASVPSLEARRSVRVDGTVLGQERIRVPAGELDTLKVRRFVYPGDATILDRETRITEFDWYAPALGLRGRS